MYTLMIFLYIYKTVLTVIQELVGKEVYRLHDCIKVGHYTLEKCQKMLM
jgi:hypothetical protein